MPVNNQGNSKEYNEIENYFVNYFVSQQACWDEFYETIYGQQSFQTYDE
ncbi:MAG: hypothetical protein MUF15_27340 [Acidobacteria bacterium]|nr:hypothetical protein [Acidobacteriota bacterium]